MRKEYMLTQAQHDWLLDTIHSTAPLIMLQAGNPVGPQERANMAWDRLGREMGFVGRTARPGSKGPLSFTADPVEDEGPREQPRP